MKEMGEECSSGEMAPSTKATGKITSRMGTED